MIRKPEPKEAAKAIVAMFAQKGIKVTRSLALEVVATVEGYNDWNTMSAAISNVSVAKPPKVSKTVRFPAVHDDDGPFIVKIDGGEYNSFERFSSANDVAEMFAAQDDEEYIVEIEDAAGRCRAMYVGDHSRQRVYWKYTPDMSVAEATRFVKDDIEHDVEADCTCFGHPDNFYDDIEEHARSGIGDKHMTFVVGYRAFDTDPSTGRVAHDDMHTPIKLALLVVHGELRYVCQDLPADVRERISALLK